MAALAFLGPRGAPMSVLLAGGSPAASCCTERSALPERALAHLLPLGQRGPGHLRSRLQIGRASCPRGWPSHPPFTEALRALSTGPGRTARFGFQPHRPVLLTLRTALANQAESHVGDFPVMRGCLLGRRRFGSLWASHVRKPCFSITPQKSDAPD